ncbi:MAG: CPBP family intramembrane metalloprotease [Oscillospiraceae bacterium]|nr:CPBP family intramembrane metalloprotease [Oscillospiraceae bacterium]
MGRFIKNIWKIICYPLMYIGIQVAVTFIYMIVFSIAVGLKIGIESSVTGEPFQMDNIYENIYDLIMSQMMIPVVISVFVTVLIIFLILRKEWAAEKFWNFARFKISPFLLCISLGAALNVLTICIIAMIPIPPQPSPIDEIVGNNMIIDLLIISVFTPVLEEIIFRGIVLKRLNKMMRRHTAVFLQALIFGIIHLNLLQGIYAFFLGVIIGYIYLWFDSIYVAIAVHCAYNATSLILFYIFGDSDVNIFYFLVISALVFIISIASLVALAERQEKKAYSHNLTGGNGNNNNDDNNDSDNRWQL